MEAVYGCLAVSKVHVDGEEMEAERSLLLCGHLRWVEMVGTGTV